MKLFSISEFRAVWDAMKVDIFTTRLFFDPLAVPLTILFSKASWMSANLVTFLALIPGLAGAYCFATGRFGWGAVAYYLFFLLDSVDGKLARLLGAGDPLGAFYDFVVDRIVISMMVFGMCISFLRQEMFTEFILAQIYILAFLMKDALDLKWKASGVAETQTIEQSYPPRFFARYKIHFKPGQLLSCFIIFIAGSVSHAHVLCSSLAIVCVLFSMGHNVVLPYLSYLRKRIRGSSGVQ